jgi:hypothetical protein
MSRSDSPTSPAALSPTARFDDRFDAYDDPSWEPMARAPGKACAGRAGSLTSLGHFLTKVSNGASKRLPRTGV